jgi:hypothetical protein
MSARRVVRRAAGAVVFGIVAALGGGVRADPPEGASGIEVVGPAESWPERWTATDKASGKVVASVSSQWGFASTPPGEYAVAVLPRGHEAVEVPWGDVKVEDKKVTRVEVTSGIEVVGRNPEEGELEHWDVIDSANGRKAAHVWHRWGFTPLPAGTYAVRVRPTGHESVEIPWAAEVRVETGKASKVAVNAGVEVVGRSEADDVPEHWEAVEKASGKTLAHAWQRWGFTPLPPGSYALRVRPRGNESVDLGWGDFTVAAGRTTTVALASGVELAPRAPGDELEHWDLVERAGGRRVVAHVWRRWGFAPVPPGAYSVRLRPAGPEALDVVWADVDVAEAKTAAVRVDSGIDLVGRTGQDPPERWTVEDAKSHAPVARVYQRYGFTPLPAGTYDVVRVPRSWKGVEVKAGQVASLAEQDVKARWATVSGAGRKTERERDPAGWKRLEEDIERAIRRAAAFLKARGEIERMDPMEADGRPTLGILALAHAGELERDPALARRAREYLMRRALNDGYGTYITSLVSMALTDMGAMRNRARIYDCAKWLVENQGWADESRRTWGYGDAVPGFDAKPPAAAGRGPSSPRPKDVVREGLVVSPNPGWDNSNAQFGVLGLHSASRARVGIPTESWKRIESHFREMQNGDGGWGYGGSGGSNGSMTCAGVASLVIARHHLGNAEPAVDPALVDGLEWLEWNFTVEQNPPHADSYHHYYLYGLERVGVLTGTEFLGKNEWYPVGARYLLKTQNGGGSWGADPFLDTCYSILFLRRATLPLETEAPALLSVTRDEASRKEDLPAVELILDCSGSMKDPVDGRQKMTVAREVITEVLAALPPEMQVGLRLYGHKQPPQKTDTELVVPIGPLDDARRNTIRGWIMRARPIGWTPMVHSLVQAKNDFQAAGKGSRTVVLVSDGEETGGGKVADVEAAYRDAGIDLVLHVVGFDVAGIPLAEQQMKELARIGKGRYFAAKGTKDLAAALREAMPAPGIEVLDASGKVVARAAFNGDPVELKPGAYRVRLAGSASEPLGVTLAEAQEARFRVDAAGNLVLDGS